MPHGLLEIVSDHLHIMLFFSSNTPTWIPFTPEDTRKATAMGPISKANKPGYWKKFRDHPVKLDRRYWGTILYNRVIHWQMLGPKPNCHNTSCI